MTSRIPQELVHAIERCCAVRGDGEGIARELIEECAELPTELHADLAAHFQDQARLFTAAAMEKTA